MAKKQRLRRQDPERTAPVRRFSTMFRPDGNHRDGTLKPPADMASDISDAVRMGYSVIEEQIRQGQRAAQQLGGAPSGLGSATVNATDIASRLLRYATDLAATQGQGSRVSIEITSNQKNQVTLDLWAGSQTASLTVPALHSAESEKTPLTDVSFVAGTDELPARLRVVIPESQPAGVYSGLILDSESSQAKGTLSLKLGE